MNGTEKVDALILMCSLETIRKYVPGVSVSSSGSMTKADRQRAITTLFSHAATTSELEQWVKSGSVISYITLHQLLPPQLAVGIARQDAVNSGVPHDRLQKDQTYLVTSRVTDNNHPAFLVIIGNLPSPT